MQRRQAASVGCIDSGTSIQQPLYHCRVLSCEHTTEGASDAVRLKLCAHHCQTKDGAAIAVNCVCIGPCRKQHLHKLHMLVLHGYKQGRFAVSVSCVDGSPCRQQELCCICHPGEPTACCEM